jgi:thiol-disulfide isomerase/thioredoxin
MSTLKNFTVTKNSSQVVDVTMKPAGKPLKIKVVDKDGKPIKGFYICIERWGEHRLVNEILLTGKDDRPQTDENGYWVWKEAPENEVVFDMFVGDSMMDLRNKPMTARDEEYVFTAFPALKVTGKVHDDATKQPIPAFKVFLGMISENSTEFYWDLQANAGKDGVYSISEDYPRDGFGVKIEAEGYEPTISRDIKPDEGTISVDFSLKKLSEEKLSQTLHGTVLTPEGKPAANATVALATHKQHLMLDNGRTHSPESYVTKTDKDGKFKFAYFDFENEREPRQTFPSGAKVFDYIIIVLHDSGFRRLTQNDMETVFKNKPIPLEKWGQVEGTVYTGTKTTENVPLIISHQFSTQVGKVYEPSAHWHYSVTSGENGKFAFKQVPTGSGSIQRGVPMGKSGGTRFSHSCAEFEVRPDETTTVKVGGDGRPVIGKLVPAEGFEKVPDWRYATVETDIMPPVVNRSGFSLLMSVLTKPGGTNKQVEKKRLQQRLCSVAADGTFRLDDVPEGDWLIMVKLETPLLPGQPWSNRITCKLDHRFTMGEIPNGVSDDPLDLGTLTVKKVEPPKPLLQVGETAPDFELPQIDASNKDAKLRLSDYKGKIIVLDFWATWCAPCLQKMPELRKLHESLKGDPRFVMIGISFDEKNVRSLIKFVTEKDLPWIHGMAGNMLDSPTAKAYGVQGIPALLLIGTDGKVLLSNPSVEELAKKIEELKK